MNNNFYTVIAEDDHRLFRHGFYQDAIKEAKRLCIKEKKSIIIMKSMSIVEIINYPIKIRSLR